MNIHYSWPKDVFLDGNFVTWAVIGLKNIWGDLDWFLEQSHWCREFRSRPLFYTEKVFYMNLYMVKCRCWFIIWPSLSDLDYGKTWRLAKIVNFINNQSVPVINITDDIASNTSEITEITPNVTKLPSKNGFQASWLDML